MVKERGRIAILVQRIDEENKDMSKRLPGNAQKLCEAGKNCLGVKKRE